MEKVATCVHKLTDLFLSLEKDDLEAVHRLSKEISQLEHEADLIRDSIQTDLPTSLFMPIERRDLLEILKLQDQIADSVEDVAVIMSLKPLSLPIGIKTDFDLFLAKNIESFDTALLIVKELHELLESSFGGIEADKVRQLSRTVATKEREGDQIQKQLLKGLIDHEHEMSYTSFYLWMKIFEKIAAVSNISERLGNQIRMTLVNS
jgi:predicted phosphate transport protein (TIGR00153 family)